MKTRQTIIAVALLALAAINSQLSTARAQTTAFTYQGRLNDNGAPASGLYDFRFKLATDDLGNAYAGNAYLTNAIPVTNGLFTTTIDFGAAVFTGTNYWLEVDVRTNNPADTLGYTALAPLQPVASTPYATFANSASNVVGTVAAAQLTGPIAAAQLSGTYSGAVNLDNAGNSFTGNGANVTNVNAVALNGLNATAFWQLGGNNVGVGQFLGSTNNQPVELHINGLRALRLEFGGMSALSGTNTLTGAPNVIGGSPVNYVASGVVGAVIGGGGATNFQGLIFTNSIGAFSDFSTIGGGDGNAIQTNSYTSTISGGNANTIQPNSDHSVIGGGYSHTIQTNSGFSVISGGYINAIQTSSPYSVISGGPLNTIQNNSAFSVIGGGYDNAIQPDSASSVISGGYDNSIETNSVYSVISGGSGNTIETNSSYSVISGGPDNTIQANSFESAIGGGYNNFVGTNSPDSFIGGGSFNTINGDARNVGSSVINGGYENEILTNADYSFIGGGLDNVVYGDNLDYGTSVIVGGDGDVIYPGSFNSFIGGGQGDSIGTNSDHAFIGGGFNNTIFNNNYEGVIAGGYYNTLSPNAAYSAIGGGQYNTNSSNGGTIAGGQQNLATGQYQSTVSGGYDNLASGNYATVPGGYQNVAGGIDSFAAGYNAVANNNGAFVWSDGSASTASTANDSVTFRASGGYRLITGTGTAGAQLLANATSWTTLSDRNAKKNFKPVDTVAVLDKLAAIPIQQWNYKWEKDSDVPNIGPMAQDFKHAFYPGRDDKGISTLEFDGVELAAIQGLNQKLNDRDAQIQTLEKQLDELQAAVKSLAEKK